VLIYKATELVNFAQGDLLMLGAFVAYMAVVWWGFDYWLAFAISVARSAFGALLDRWCCAGDRQPQFAVVMLTIGSAPCSAPSPASPGARDSHLPTPFSGVDLGATSAIVSVDHRRHADPVRRPLTPSSITRLGVAMQRPRRTSSPPTRRASR
jgi:branched-subunit amino acid ABC-type transport system permease component